METISAFIGFVFGSMWTAWVMQRMAKNKWPIPEKIKTARVVSRTDLERAVHFKHREDVAVDKIIKEHEKNGGSTKTNRLLNKIFGR